MPGGSANIRSPEIIAQFRAHFLAFETSCQQAVADIKSDVKKAQDWLTAEQLSHWKLQLRKREEIVNQAQREYLRAMHSGAKTAKANTVDLKKALDKAKRAREEAEKNNKDDYKKFLKDCNISMLIRPVEEKDWERVVQLFNRTNDLTTTGNRYELEKLKNAYKKNEIEIIVAELKDKFGDYGLIAETLIDTRTEDWEIKDLTVSCSFFIL